MNIKRALIIGRFQPLHLGHVKVIEEAAREYDEIIIGIGSSQESHTLKNPFTAGERIMMIKNAMDEMNCGRNNKTDDEDNKIDNNYNKINDNDNDNDNKINYLILPIPDVHNNSIWVAHVLSLVPKFDVVYSRNNLVKRLFREAGFTVKEQELYDRGKHEGTEIRRRIAEGKPWENLVPKAVYDVITGIGGAERIRELDIKP